MMCAFSSAPCWACAAASVIEAADGEDAVQLAEQDCPDLILMDGSLPPMVSAPRGGYVS
jgi:CheY-like chemotaxis protein